MSKNLVKALPTLWELSGRNHNFVRLGGLSGAAAVILGAVGSHHAKFKDNAEMRAIFDTANRFHFFHSIALLGVPLAKYPMVVGINYFGDTEHIKIILFIFLVWRLDGFGHSTFQWLFVLSCIYRQ